MKQRAVTLLELLVSLFMTVLVLWALTGAYIAGLDYSRRAPERIAAFQEETGKRRSISDLLARAYLSPRVDDQSTYFIGWAASGQGLQVDTLTFTTIADRPQGGYTREVDTDFETLHIDYGPQGGVTEIALSTTPIGVAPEGEGIFIREQRPADGDYTQGGSERLLIPDARNLTFRFWDGVEWIDTWDTFANQRRLPSAVEISFNIGDTDDLEIYVVRLRNSDITSLDPLVLEGGG